MAVHQYESPPAARLFTSKARTPIALDARQRWRVEKYGSLEKAVDAYDNAVVFTDRLVGELFNAIAARFPDTLLIVTSDHGEEFFDHGGYEHGLTLYNEVLWVPCVLWGPGVPRGEVAEVTDSLDLLPTIAAAAGTSLPAPAGPCPLRSRGSRAGEGRELRRAA